ncbi:MAG: hypothetical protein QNJ72_05540 [Pleurocapsa sp. MO_226.B13]|nr:hypothetical protein [Pleurocapsa sp. MO_226.B13]
MFFLLLITTIASIVIYFCTSSDIFALLGVCMGICCLIWGLIMVHWLIHLLTLLVLIFILKPVAVATVDSRHK